MKTNDLNPKLLLVGAFGHLLCWVGGDLLLYFVLSELLDTMACHIPDLIFTFHLL